MLLRGVHPPNEVFVLVEFETVEQANAYRERVRDSDVLQDVAIRVAPTVAELSDQRVY